MSDRYFYSPDGTKFRSMAEVNRFLNGEGDDGGGKKSPAARGRSKSPVKNGKKDSKKATAAATAARSKSPAKAKARSKSPTKKKAAPPKNKPSTTTTKVKRSKPKYPIGTSVSKEFYSEEDGEERPFSGEVISYDMGEKLYSVRYEDGDEEDLNEGDLSEIVAGKGGNSKKGGKRKSVDEGTDKMKNGALKKKGDGESEEEEEEESAAKKKKKKARKAILEDSDDEDDDAMEEDGGEKKGKSKNALDTLMSGRKPRRSAQKKIAYAESDDEEMVDSEDEEEEDLPKKKKAVSKAKAGKAKAAPSKKKGGKKSKRAAADSDSDEFELGSEADDDDEESFKGDTESEIEGDSDFDEEPKKKKGGKKAAASSKKGAKKGATKKEDKKPAAAKGKKAAPDSIHALCAAKAKDIKVLNNPQQFPEAGPYVEPVGIDATDGIVEGIIGGMVQKVGKLLLKTLKRKDDERELGELNFPIKLNTACSGTDAPSIALGLVKESLDRFVSHTQEGTDSSDEDGDEKMKDDGEKNKKKEHGFDYEHNMSCEIEPFKQAYIGRNFQGVLLFPDITKLTEKETVVDVYGRDQHVPEGKC